MDSKKKELIGTTIIQSGTSEPIEVGTNAKVSNYIFNLVPETETKCREPTDTEKEQQCNSFAVGTQINHLRCQV